MQQLGGLWSALLCLYQAWAGCEGFGLKKCSVWGSSAVKDSLTSSWNVEQGMDVWHWHDEVGCLAYVWVAGLVVDAGMQCKVVPWCSWEDLLLPLKMDVTKFYHWACILDNRLLWSRQAMALARKSSSDKICPIFVRLLLLFAEKSTSCWGM